MKIAILSGKGGTGKTLVSVNLVAIAGRSRYVDCDVEEPNGHLFLAPVNPAREEVSVLVPVIDSAKCLGCRACVQFCQFGALAFVKGKPLLTESICHSCGGCAYLCPASAISERPRTIGIVERGSYGAVDVSTGILNTGEVSGVPIIRALLADIDAAVSDIFIDCPPGTACAAMECVRAADLCVLVAEPTTYGAHNLEMADELCGALHRPRVAVLNKCLEGVDNPSETYCLAHGIPIVARIRFDEQLGALNSIGLVASERIEWVKTVFEELLAQIRKEVTV